MGKGPRRDAELERQWRALVEDHERSGLSIQSFCCERGVSASSFHYWRRELARREGQRPTGGRRQVSRAVGDFVPVRVTSSVAGATEAIEIDLAGALVRVRRGFDEEALARVVAVLGDRAPRAEARPC